MSSLWQPHRGSPAATAAIVTLVGAGAAVLYALLPPRPLRDRLRGPQPDELTQIDNDIYEGEGGFWDDAEDAPLRLVNAARIPYFASIWEREVQPVQGEERRFLDVGCGGGVATEELAKLSFVDHIVGLDPAKGAIRHAQQRVKQLNLNGKLSYVTGSAFSLPFPSNHFNGVVSSDVIEHLEDVSAALAEVYRVLKPGGVFVFDTIHRTAYSWLTTILVAQRLLRYIPEDAHDWRLYVTPQEMRHGLEKAGFEVSDEREQWSGMGPSLYAPHRVLWRLLVEKKGRASLFGPWGQSRWNKQASYLGWARKPLEKADKPE